jgi:hypothetical protein
MTPERGLDCGYLRLGKGYEALLTPKSFPYCLIYCLNRSQFPDLGQGRRFVPLHLCRIEWTAFFSPLGNGTACTRKRHGTAGCSTLIAIERGAGEQRSDY